MQTSLFDGKEPESLKPGLTIEQRIIKYHTTLNGMNGYCECEHHRHRPYEDCIHIKELRLQNLKHIDETILDHIAVKRDHRDQGNDGLEGAITRISNNRPDEFHDLLEIVMRLAKQNGQVTSDDLHAVTNEAYHDDRIVGTVFAVLSKAGVLEEIGRKPTERKCAHGRKINIYRLSDKNTFNNLPPTLKKGG